MKREEKSESEIEKKVQICVCLNEIQKLNIRPESGVEEEWKLREQKR